MTHHTTTSHHPAAGTFSYLATFSNTANWDPGVISAGQLDPGPVRSGTRFRLVVPFLSRRMALAYQVVKLVPGREVVLAAEGRLVRATDQILVAPGVGATVSYEASVRLRGPLRLLDALLRPGFRAVGERAAAGLGRALAAPPVPQQRPWP
jgi:dehydrogenase/reductase SDR family member 12